MLNTRVVDNSFPDNEYFIRFQILEVNSLSPYSEKSLVEMDRHHQPSPIMESKTNVYFDNCFNRLLFRLTDIYKFKPIGARE